MVKLVVDRGGPPISFQCRYGSANSSLPRSREGKEDSIASPFLSAPCSRKSGSSTTCLYLAVDGKSDISHDTLQLALSLLLPLFDVFSRPLIPPLPTFDQWSRSTVTPKGTSWRAANFPSTGRLTKKRGTFQSLCGDCSPGAPRNIRRKGIVELAAGDA